MCCLSLLQHCCWLREQEQLGCSQQQRTRNSGPCGSTHRPEEGTYLFLLRLPVELLLRSQHSLLQASSPLLLLPQPANKPQAVTPKTTRGCPPHLSACITEHGSSGAQRPGRCRAARQHRAARHCSGLSPAPAVPAAFTVPARNLAHKRILSYFSAWILSCSFFFSSSLSAASCRSLSCSACLCSAAFLARSCSSSFLFCTSSLCRRSSSSWGAQQGSYSPNTAQEQAPEWRSRSSLSDPRLGHLSPLSRKTLMAPALQAVRHRSSCFSAAHSVPRRPNGHHTLHL